jgi:hypothetical protein
MKEKIDPFVMACMFLIFCCLFFFCCVIFSERREKNIKAELIKEAIQKNWTPEQVKLLLESK